MSARLIVFTLTLGACIDRGKVDEAYVAENTLTTEPKPAIAINAEFGEGKIVYLGADLDKTEVARGDRVRVTHFWKIVQPLGPEWRVFTHVVSPDPSDWVNADNSKLRQNHPVSRWRAGEILRDEQILPIKTDWKSDEAWIVVGFFPKGAKSDADRLSITPSHDDGKKRLVVAKLKVLPRGTRATQPDFKIRRTPSPIVLDGKGDDAAWARAPWTSEFLTVEGAAFPVQPTRAKLLWDQENLYVLVELEDDDIASQYKVHDEPIWKEDCVELFIDADRSGRGYVELQVNPHGTTFDSWFKTQRPDGDVPWESGMKVAVELRGTVDDRGDTDRGWTAEIAIPLAAVKGRDDEMAVTIPPAIGDRWRLNIVRVEKQKQLSASAWAPITIQDFHAIERLNTVVFADADGVVDEKGRDGGTR